MCGTRVNSLMCAVDNRATRHVAIVHTHTELHDIAHTGDYTISGTAMPNCSQNPARLPASSENPQCSKTPCGTRTQRKGTSSPSSPPAECGWIGAPVATKRRASTSGTWTCHSTHATDWWGTSQKAMGVQWPCCAGTSECMTCTYDNPRPTT